MSNPPPTQILLADDDAVSRLALAGLLNRLPGVDVVECVDGQDAWDRLQQGLRPLVCCTDVHMPRLDGIALLKKVKAHPVLAHMPVGRPPLRQAAAVALRAAALGTPVMVSPMLTVGRRRLRSARSPGATPIRSAQCRGRTVALMTARRSRGRHGWSTATASTGRAP